MLPPFVRVVTLKYPPLVKTVLGDWKGSVRARLIADDPRERRRQDDGPLAPDRAGARARRPVRRGRRRSARDGACEPGRRRPRRALRPPCLHRLARPLPDLVAGTAPGDASTAARRSTRRSHESGKQRSRRGRWLRGYGWRDGDWSPYVAPTKEALDEVTGETPTIMISKDYHSAWLNSAALAAADGDLDLAGGVVERDEQGEPTGILREEAAWRFRDRYVLTTEDEWVEATRAGVKLANSRGVAAVHDKDGWLGSPGIFQRLRDEGNLSLRVWGSIPHDQLDSAAALLAPLRLRGRVPPDRLPEVLHGRDARLADRAADRRLGRRDHLARGARGDHPARRRARLARRGPRDRRPGEQERSRRLRGDAGTPGSTRACGSGSSTRSA